VVERSGLGHGVSYALTIVAAAGHEEGGNERGWHAAVAGGADAIHGAWYVMTCPVRGRQRRCDGYVHDGTLMVDGTLQRNVALSSVRAAEKQSERRGQREQGRAGQGRAARGQTLRCKQSLTPGSPVAR
jgi:hypothetical protein